MSTGVAVLGSTGSVGKTTLKVLRHLGESYFVAGLAAGRGIQALRDQIREFRPRIVSVESRQDAERLRDEFAALEVHWGAEGAEAVAACASADIVVAAIVGSRALKPTYRALSEGKRVALANKEALVMAGRFMIEAARRSGAHLVPVDSEHCAIFQCLRGEDPRAVRRIILTASGGGLRDLPLEDIPGARAEQVLNHPTWKMGPKITVDSATMVNKGLEVIEAHHLFSLPLERIEVILHPQSLVHSMVEFEDGAMLAQLADADMALPVQYALTFPERRPGTLKFLDLAALPPLGFARPDPRRYPCLSLSREAARSSETHAIALNAANEVAVEAFLAGQTTFAGIARVIGGVLEQTPAARPGDLEEVIRRDADSRRLAREILLTVEAS